MKLNWGTGIAITLIAFATLMSFMVYLAMQQDFDLVSEDYYGEELQFQDVIDGKQAALSLSDKPRLQRTEEGVFLYLPADFNTLKKTFEVHMYHEIEADNDFRFSEENTMQNRFEIPFTTYDKGKWIAKIKLQSAGKHYYFEPEITL